MHPALTNIQNDVRAAELRQRAERRRTFPSQRRSTRSPEETGAVKAAARAPIFGALFLGHGFFGREHGTHA